MKPAIRKPLAVFVAVVLVVGTIGGLAYFGGDQYSPAQNVSASHGGTHIDDFEDGDTNVETNGWTGWSGDTANFQASSSNPIEGTYSGAITSTSSDDTVTVTRSSTIQANRVAFQLRVEGDTADTIQLRVASGATNAIKVELNGDGSVDVLESGGRTHTGMIWYEGVTYKIEFRNIDYANDQFDLYINGQDLGTYAFSSAVSNMDNIDIRHITSGTTRTLYIDDVQIDGSAYSIDKMGGSVVDDFESGNLTPADGWAGWKNETSGLAAQKKRAIHGSYSARYYVDNADKEVSLVSDSGQYSRSRFAFVFNVSEISSGDGTAAFALEHQNSDVIEVEFATSNVVRVLESGGATDTGFDWARNITYHVEYRNINWSAGKFDFFVNGHDLGRYNFRNSADGFDRFEVRGITSTSAANWSIHFDDIQLGGTNYSEPKYTVGTTDDFEDGNVRYRGPGHGGYFGDTSSVSISSSNSIAGSYSAKFTSAGADAQIELWKASRAEHSEVSFKVHINSTTSTTSDAVGFELTNEGTSIIYVEFEDSSGDVAVFEGVQNTTSAVWSPGVDYTVKFTNIDWSNDQFDLVINGTNYGTYGFRNSAPGYDKIVLRNAAGDSLETRTLWFDDLSGGTYDSNTNFTLTKATSTVSGYVLDNDGNPITDASVNVTNTTDSTVVDSALSTNASGGYSISLVNDKDYNLTGYADGYNNATESVTGLSADTVVNITLLAPAGSSDSPPASTYLQPFVLDSHTNMIRAETSEVTAQYWTDEGTIGDDETDDRCNVKEGDQICSPAGDEDSGGFGLGNEVKLRLYDDVAYNIQVHDQSTGGFYQVNGIVAQKTVSDRPTSWWDNEFISDDVDADKGDFVIIVEGIQDIIKPENQVNVDTDGDGTTNDEPYISTGIDDDGDATINYHDPEANTTQIEYNYTVDGEQYTFNRTFDEPISNFSTTIPDEGFNQDGSFDDISDVEFGYTSGGNRTFDTIEFGAGGSSFGKNSTGLFGPIQSGGGSGGSGNGPSLWWIAAIVAALGYVFRKDIAKVLRM